MSCTGAAKKEKLEGELGGQTPVGKQWGTERKVLGVLWNESEAAQWETPTCFPAKPSLSSLRAELSAPWKTLLPFQRTLIPECLEHTLPSTTGEQPQTPL